MQIKIVELQAQQPIIQQQKTNHKAFSHLIPWTMDKDIPHFFIYWIHNASIISQYTIILSNKHNTHLHIRTNIQKQRNMDVRQQNSS